MTALHRHLTLTEDPQVPYLAVSKKTYEPNTENLILAARGLHPGPKAVLAHVCQLFEHGGFLCYNANNQYIATALGITEPMASRHIHALAERGLLLVTPRVGGQKRTLTPSQPLQDAYRCKSLAKITEVVKSAGKSGKTGLKSGKNSESGKMSGKSGKADFTSSVKRFYQFGKHIIITLEERNLLRSRVAELEALNAELFAANAAHQKKEGELSTCFQILACSSEEELKTLWQSLQEKPSEESALRKAFSQRRRQLTELKAQPPATIVAGPAPKRARRADPLAGKGKLMLDVYRDWYRQANHAEAPAPGAAEQVAARAIYAALVAQPGAGTDEATSALFAAMLQNWSKLEPFLQRQQKLTQIAANLTNIIPQLIHHANPASSLNPANRPGLIPADEYARARAACKALGL